MVIRVEVWSDFVCPFCYIGKRRLELALAQFSHGDEVVVEFKSFELDPGSPRDTAKSVHEVLAEKYGMSVAEAQRTHAGLAKHAESVGLVYRFDSMQPTNTFDAHRLVKFAKSFGRDAELTERLFSAYFTDSENISDVVTLAEVAEGVGLSRAEALKVIQDKNAFANDVRIDEEIARQIGVTGVPFFVVNQRYSISGAQPTETFIDALDKVWEERLASPVLPNMSRNNASQGELSGKDCIIPGKGEQ